MLPVPVRTIYDLGYIVTRKVWFVHFISLILIISCILRTVIYLILFGDIVKDIALNHSNGSIITTRAFYVLTVGALFTPFFFQKRLVQLNFASIGLVACTTLFIFGFFYQFFTIRDIMNP